MRSNCGIYVDAGYLLAAAATRVTGTSLRNGIAVDYPSLLQGLISEAEALAALPVLRVNWYDAAPNGIPDQEQEGIGILPKVKLRLGRFGFDGQQKGVDLRIGLDMVAHARNGAVDTIVLVSGDDDLTEAVEEAQVHGVLVIVLAVPTVEGRPHGVSKHLHRAADNLEVMDVKTLESSIRRPAPTVAATPSPTPATPAPGIRAPSPAVVAGITRPQSTGALAYSGTTGAPPEIAVEYAHTDEEVSEMIDVVAEKALTSFLASAAAEDLASFEFGRPSIPRDLDRALLVDLSDALNTYNLSDGVRTQLRKRFWEMVDADER